MSYRVGLLSGAIAAVLLVGTSSVQAQTAERGPWFADVAIGFAPSVNGNVNSGAIGSLEGQTAAILPQSYGEVYGTGPDFRFGGGYSMNELVELRGMFVYQTADADLVRLGDFGESSLYAQYSDYQSLGLDLGIRGYFPLEETSIRPYGEVTIGAAFIDAIDVVFAAPQSNVILDETNFYDQAGAFTFGVNFGILMPLNDRLDFNAQFGVRHVSGLPEVAQFTGSGLESINSDSSRLTMPIVLGLRIYF